MLRPWPLKRARELLGNRIFRLSARLSVSPRTGNQHEFYVLEAPDWVNVVPLTDDRQVVMVRQYRHGLREVTLEIPGGMVDPEDADPGAAARRELLEETGYAAADVQRLGQISPNPALHDNFCHSYLATGLTYRGPQELDGGEDIEVETVPLDAVPELIRDGRIVHALVVVAFCYLFGLNSDTIQVESPGSKATIPGGAGSAAVNPTRKLK